MDDKTGEFRYESRSVDETVSLELLNCTEKDRYMIVFCAPCGTVPICQVVPTTMILFGSELITRLRTRDDASVAEPSIVLPFCTGILELNYD